MHEYLQIFLHLDKVLEQAAAGLGPGPLYALLFAIIFCETGLVVTPFLPGDSLLFAVGALIATGKIPLSLAVVLPLLFVAGVVGDALNYAIGRKVGPAVFNRESSWLFDKKNLVRAQAFYERYGGKAIVLARFVPIVRTFAPFVAGIGKMQYRRFAMFNVVGAGLWIVLLTLAGHTFGELPFVKRHFELIVIGIVLLSVLPAAVEVLRERARSRRAAA